LGQFAPSHFLQAHYPLGLRITPTPFHDDRLIDQLAVALVDAWERLGLAFCRRPAISPRVFQGPRLAEPEALRI
jgi:hypothetical protein